MEAHPGGTPEPNMPMEAPPPAAPPPATPPPAAPPLEELPKLKQAVPVLATPMLLLSVPGTPGEDLLSRVLPALEEAGTELQCATTASAELDRVAPLVHFKSIVLLLAGLSTSREINRAIRELVPRLTEYRRDNPRALEAALGADKDWYRIGVVHVVARHIVCADERVRAPLDALIDVWHDLDTVGDPDIIGVYLGRLPPSQTTKAVVDQLQQDFTQAWATAKSWSVSSYRQACALRGHLDRMARALDSPTSPETARRPAPELTTLNALDIIFTGLNVSSPDRKIHKARTEYLGAVTAKTIAGLQQHHPALARPGRGPGASRQLGELYRALKLIEQMGNRPHH